MRILIRILNAIALTCLNLRIMWRKVELRMLCHHAERRLDEVILLQEHLALYTRAVSPRLSGLYMCLLKGPGYGSDESGALVSPFCWNAPIGFTFYIDDTPCIGLGVELRDKVLCIRQMQGAKGSHILPALRSWPTVLVEACVEYARTHGMREVRVYKANQELGFHFPVLDVPVGTDRTTALQEHQNRMRRRYDRTAHDLGFEKRRTHYFRQIAGEAQAQ